MNNRNPTGFRSSDGWTIDTKSVYQKSERKVGINTDTPQYDLDVQGDLNVNGEFRVSSNIYKEVDGSMKRVVNLVEDTVSGKTVIDHNNDIELDISLLNATEKISAKVLEEDDIDESNLTTRKRLDEKYVKIGDKNLLNGLIVSDFNKGNEIDPNGDTLIFRFKFDIDNNDTSKFLKNSAGEYREVSTQDENYLSKDLTNQDAYYLISKDHIVGNTSLELGNTNDPTNMNYSYIMFPAVEWDNIPDITFTFWIKFNNNNTKGINEDQTIFENQNEQYIFNFTTNKEDEWSLKLEDKKLVYESKQIRDGDTSIYRERFECQSVLTYNTWYHITFIIDKDGFPKNMKIYINGIEEVLTSIENINAKRHETFFIDQNYGVEWEKGCIGNKYKLETNNPYQLYACIDDIRIYHSALSFDDIAKNITGNLLNITTKSITSYGNPGIYFGQYEDKLGFGTTEPQAKFHIVGDTKISGGNLILDDGIDINDGVVTISNNDSDQDALRITNGKISVRSNIDNTNNHICVITNDEVRVEKLICNELSANVFTQKITQDTTDQNISIINNYIEFRNLNSGELTQDIFREQYDLISLANNENQTSEDVLISSRSIKHVNNDKSFTVKNKGNNIRIENDFCLSFWIKIKNYDESPNLTHDIIKLNDQNTGDSHPLDVLLKRDKNALQIFFNDDQSPVITVSSVFSSEWINIAILYIRDVFQVFVNNVFKGDFIISVDIFEYEVEFKRFIDKQEIIYNNAVLYDLNTTNFDNVQFLRYITATNFMPNTYITKDGFSRIKDSNGPELNRSTTFTSLLGIRGDHIHTKVPIFINTHNDPERIIGDLVINDMSSITYNYYKDVDFDKIPSCIISSQRYNGSDDLNTDTQLIHLYRKSNSDELYDGKVSLSLSRWKDTLLDVNTSMKASRTQLDIGLCHNKVDDSDVKVISIRSDGKVGINNTVPVYELDVSGGDIATCNIVLDNGGKIYQKDVSGNIIEFKSSYWKDDKQDLNILYLEDQVYGDGNPTKVIVGSNVEWKVGTTNEDYRMFVNGGVNVLGDLNFTGEFKENGVKFVSSRWEKDDNTDVVYVNDTNISVGIGTNYTFGNLLYVNGNAQVNSLTISDGSYTSWDIQEKGSNLQFTHDNDTNTMITFDQHGTIEAKIKSDLITISDGSYTSWDIQEKGNNLQFTHNNDTNSMITFDQHGTIEAKIKSDLITISDGVGDGSYWSIKEDQNNNLDFIYGGGTNTKVSFGYDGTIHTDNNIQCKQIQINTGWTIQMNNNNDLEFKNNANELVFKITSSGALVAKNDITAFNDNI